MNLFRRSLLAKKSAIMAKRRKAFLQGGTQRRGLQAERLETRAMMAADILVNQGSEYWNPRNPEDVNADGYVAPNDALAVINALNSSGSLSLSAVPKTSVSAAGESGSTAPVNSLLYDVNNDGFLSPIDALAVINRLNAAEGETTPVMQYTVKAVATGASFGSAALTSVNVGQDYDLVVTVKDLRTGGTGVYAGFLDMQFPTGNTSVEIQELQQVSIPDTANDGGTFRLTLGAQTTADITYNASSLPGTASAIQSALNATLGAGSVTVVADDLSPNFLVRFQGSKGDQNIALMTATNLTLGAGNNPTVSNTITVGEANPINGDFTSTRAYLNSFRFNSLYSTAKSAQDGQNQVSPGPFQGIDDAGGAYSRTSGTLGTAEREIWRVRMNAVSGGTVNLVGSTLDQSRPFHDTLMFATSGTTNSSNALALTQAEISIVSTSINILQPVDAINDAYTLPEKSVAFQLSPSPLANDTQTTAPALSIVTTGGTTAQGGTFTRVGTGSSQTFTYTPPSSTFNGTDSFNYTITDGTNQDTATITLTVTPVNDAPTLTLPGTQTVNEHGTVTYGGATAITVNDVDAGSSNVVMTIVFTNTDVTFTPPAAVAGVTVGFSTLGNQTTVTLTGPTNLINQQLNGLQISPIAREVNFTTTASVNVNDQGNTGSGGAKSASGTLTINVTAVNDPPVNSVPGAQNTTDEDPLVFTAANGNAFSFTDDGVSSAAYRLTFSVNNGTLTASAAAGVTVTSNGTASIVLNGTKAALQSFLAAGSITYVSAVNFAGVDTLTLVTSDLGSQGSGGTQIDTDTVSITVVPKTRPKAIDDAQTVSETNGATTYKINVLANDRPHDGFAATLLSIGSIPANQGTIAINDNGTPADQTDDWVDYTPAADYFTPAGSPVTFTYVVNDTVPVGNVSPTRGVDSTGTVRITVTNTPDAPTAVQDGPYAAVEDTLLTVPAASGVLANDSSLDLVSFTAVLVSGPSNISPGGSFTLNSDGSFSYKGATNFNGADSFVYKARDINGLDSAPITVVINVAAVNDPPVAGSTGPYAVDEDNTLTVSTRATGVLGNATDVDSPVANLIAVLDTAPSAAATQSFTLNPDGTFVFVPKADFNGQVTFTFHIQDDGSPTAISAIATATITVRPVNDPPVAVDDGTAISPAYTVAEDTQLNATAPGILANDTDIDSPASALRAVLENGPSHFSLFTLNANGSFIYKGAQDYNGPDSFTYRVFDGSANSVGTATVYLNVTPVNDAPVASNDTFAVDEDTLGSYTVLGPKGSGVLANDNDVDSPSLTAVLVSGPAHALSFTLNANGTFSYQGAANFNGSDSFTYRAFDGNLQSNIATVFITVNPVNDIPPVANDNFTAIKDFVNQPINVLANDGVNNPDGPENLTISQIVTPPTNGTVSISGDSKTLIYTPTAGYEGPDSLVYRVSDGNGGFNDATVTIDVVRFRPTDIAGTVFMDPNNDGLIGSGETRRLGGVEVQLSGTDFQGLVVSLMATTDINGQYRFVGVRPGEYTVTELQPEGSRDGKEVLLGSTTGAAIVSNDRYHVSLPILGVTGGVNDLNFAELGMESQFTSIGDLLSSDGGWIGSSTNYGAVVAMGPGGFLWASKLDGWANLKSISISATSDANVAILNVTDLAGNSYTRNIYQIPPTGTTGRFRIMGSTSAEKVYRLDGTAADFGLNLLSAATLPAPEGEAQSYAEGVDAAMTEENWA
ncbi:MAG: beta strand repeat-containing protein [Planctomycetaceae bacterium]